MTRNARILLTLGIIGVLIWGLGKVSILYVDYLWFNSLGFAGVFTTELTAKVALAAIVFVLTGVWVGGNLWLASRLSPGRYIQIRGLPWVIPSPQLKRTLGIVAVLAVVLVSFEIARLAAGMWYESLQFLNRSSFGWSDPILGYDAGFYVFVLPMLEAVRTYVMALAVLAAIATAGAYFVGGALGWPYAGMTRSAMVHLATLVVVFLVGLAFGYWLDRFDLLLGSQGIVHGAGYVDVHVRMPVYLGLAVASLLTAVVVLIAALKGRIRPIYTSLIILLLLHVGGAWSYPSFSQRFDVEPNELVREAPYIQNNIQATREAYDIANVEVRPYSAIGTLSLKDVEQITGTIENVRIWDWRVLLSTYNQIESLRPYYHFNDVDVDRYTVNSHYRQVTLAARELETHLLNPDSRTWVNLHLLYTHGYGLVMSPTSAVTTEGLPELWVRNIPPTTSIGIPITRPELYFGELTHDYVFVRTTQKEFDYPLGDENRYNQYEGRDGVAVASSFQRLLFAYYFGDWNILLTGSFTPETKVLWNRQVEERIHRIAPFMGFDGDPYIVILNGRIVWVIDGYTTTDRSPYSTPVRHKDLGRLNYIRNSVKTVVDAYDGSVAFYVIDPQDPLIMTARSIFPTLFKTMAEMPEPLKAHLRYPNDLFEIQAEQYLAYHMTDPQIFYNKEDLWQRPRHIFDGQTEALEAYYFIMNLPEEKRPEYLLMLPFTPAKKDNMVGWMAGRCDGESYGKLLVYTFPKDHLIFGPNQVEARINQNDEISPQLSLWNQHGSRVVRGNLMVIPVGNSILYVEPLYLKSENAAIPELKRIIVSYQDRIAMRNTLDEALAAVFGSGPAAPKPTEVTATEAPPAPAAPSPNATRALELYKKAQQEMRKGDWAAYGTTIEELGKVLEKMSAEAQKK